MMIYSIIRPVWREIGCERVNCFLDSLHDNGWLEERGVVVCGMDGMLGYHTDVAYN